MLGNLVFMYDLVEVLTHMVFSDLYITIVQPRYGTGAQACAFTTRQVVDSITTRYNKYLIFSTFSALL